MKIKQKILITGASGQLGQEFIKTLDRKGGFDVVALDRKRLDITSFDKMYEVIKEVKPMVVINCAAYNMVDEAENYFEEAVKVNSLGPLNLAILCKEFGCFLVHFSTDYVFDGEKLGFYNEEDPPNPINKYGISKYLGEINIINILDSNYLIFRVSWVYGRGKRNFLYKLEQWASESPVVRVACDEFSVPTSTQVITEISLRSLKQGLTGLYHLTNSGWASRYEWAREYFRLKGIKNFLYPSHQNEFGLRAKRPRWSVMSNEKISEELGIEIPDWKESLRVFVNEKQ